MFGAQRSLLPICARLWRGARGDLPDWILSLMSELANTIAGLERQRLLALVGRRVKELDALHAPDFELIHPSGGVWSRGEYLGGIASGEIDYRRFEATSSRRSWVTMMWQLCGIDP